ncbi:hypothetical protein NADFUDRAFT_82247 [Nadsonia fulvescens var. elongata DSM 6958]|uniref:Adenylate cyclase n=1 Tax=Nadsonia fulvescens var. elongata DSM 6958 TaxID=857566 RepID=A0A1E3PLW2_9ASCO|nr:hypothetical protein NADFUDRAFT_82247 [Nadsonia fulvescens var. elongata DSM 6958]
MSEYTEAEAMARNQKWLNQAPQFHIPFEAPYSSSQVSTTTLSEDAVAPLDPAREVPTTRGPSIATNTNKSTITLQVNRDSNSRDSAPPSPRSTYVKPISALPIDYDSSRRTSTVSQASASSSGSTQRSLKKVFDFFHDNSSSEKIAPVHSANVNSVVSGPGGSGLTPLSRVSSTPSVNSTTIPLSTYPTASFINNSVTNNLSKMSTSAFGGEDKKKRHRFHLLSKRRNLPAQGDSTINDDQIPSTTPMTPYKSPINYISRPRTKSRMSHGETTLDHQGETVGQTDTDTASLTSLSDTNPQFAVVSNSNAKPQKSKRSLLGKFIHRKDSIGDLSDKEYNSDYPTSPSLINSPLHSPSISLSNINTYPFNSTDQNNDQLYPIEDNDAQDPLSRPSVSRTNSKFSLSGLTSFHRPHSDAPTNSHQIKGLRRERWGGGNSSTVNDEANLPPWSGAGIKPTKSHTSLLNLLPHSKAPARLSSVSTISSSMQTSPMSPMTFSTATSPITTMAIPTATSATSSPATTSISALTNSTPVSTTVITPESLELPEKPLWALDTDLEHMAGIVNPEHNHKKSMALSNTGMISESMPLSENNSQGFKFNYDGPDENEDTDVDTEEHMDDVANDNTANFDDQNKTDTIIDVNYEISTAADANIDYDADTRSVSTSSISQGGGEHWTAPESWAVEEISLPPIRQEDDNTPRSVLNYNDDFTTNKGLLSSNELDDDNYSLSPFSSSARLSDVTLGNVSMRTMANNNAKNSIVSTNAKPNVSTSDSLNDANELNDSNGIMSTAVTTIAPPPYGQPDTLPSPDFVNGRKSSTNEAIKPPHSIAFIRIFRHDGSFSTVSCFMDTTVAELLQILSRKFFLPSIAGYQLTITVGGLTRLMSTNEYPLVIQRRLLKSVGYRSSDRLSEMGREDLSYLCKFKFSKRHVQNFNDNDLDTNNGTMDINGEFESVNSANTVDFKNVQLANHGLQIVPILFYKHAAKIESLDVSKNPFISVPLDFIQSCSNLCHVNFSHNRVRNFPLNLIQTGRLKSLNLSCNYLAELPESIFDNLANLTSLQLQGNMIMSLPASFSRLSSIKCLNLSSNNLLAFPEVICQLDTLEDITLSFNQITSVPPSIAKLAKLQCLALDNNRLTKQLPSTFTALKCLRKVDISNNQLQNVDNLALLPSLEVLKASGNSITYMVNNSSSKIQSLMMDRNPITMVSCNIPLSNLSTLNLSRAKLASFTDNFLEKTPSLEKLILDRNHFVSLPAELCALKRLSYLSCASNNLANIPTEIGQLSNLRYLDIHSNNLRKLPEEVWNLAELAYLNVSSNLLDAFPKQNFHSASISSTDTLYRLNNATAATSVTTSSNDIPSSSFDTAPKHNSGEFDADYELKFACRPSSFSLASTTLSPMETSRRGSIIPPPLSLTASPKMGGISDNGNVGSKVSLPTNPFGNSNQTRSSVLLKNLDNPSGGSGNGRPHQNLANSLRVLIIADNRLTDDSFEEISLLNSLQVLNMSYNELVDIPYGAFGRFNQLTELYLSGNMMTSLPADDLENLDTLVLLYVNGNKLHSLPAELGKISHLAVLDVGSNQLKYNISNWPYDWNWNFNLELQYLNFSGNKRLEIKRSNYNNQFVSVRGSEITDLSDFTVLNELKTLGLMDVTLTTTSVPDQSENCRVRTYGSEIHSMPYGLADCLGNNRENLSNIDMVIERFRGNENEVIVGLFDGLNENSENGNRVSKLLQETFGKAFTEELKKMRDNDTVSDALYRAFLSTNKEIGLAALTPANERAGTAPSAHRSITASHLNTDDGFTGSCATICYINEQSLYVANVGDTTAILATSDGQYQVVTTDHTLTNPVEQARIRASGGLISPDAKLDGIVGVSRAFGFYNIIPYIMTAPDIVERTITESDELLIMANKELWQYMNHETAVDIARTEKGDPMLAAQKLRDFAIAYGASDKIMVICLAVGGSRRSKQHRDKIKAISGGAYSLYGNTMSSQGSDDDIYPLFKRKRDKSLLPEDSNLARLGGEVDPPVGELAMVFTDIKNSTIMWETYPTAMRSAIKIHNSVMRRQLRIVGGYEVKTEGDAFMVSFPTPVSALLWCLFVQSQLLVADWPTEMLDSTETCEIEDDNQNILYRGLSVRMGIHWGAPVCERDPITRRMDYFGPMVNRASRVSAVADGGQIMVSADFLSEMRRLEIIYKRTQESGQMIYEAYGDEALGLKITKGMKMLESVGWVVKEVGESKLKGLENPEFLSLVFSKQLAGRMSFTTPPDPLLTEHPRDNSPEMVFPNQRQLLLGGEITVKSLFVLRDLSLRLEHLCSNFNGSKTYNKTSRPSEAARKNMGLSLVSRTAPGNEPDLALLLEHIITRIENSILNMSLRLTINRSGANNGGLLRDMGPNNISVDSIIGLLHQLKINLDTADAHQNETEQSPQSFCNFDDDYEV